MILHYIRRVAGIGRFKSPKEETRGSILFDAHPLLAVRLLLGSLLTVT
jgi:hypothetical protein